MFRMALTRIFAEDLYAKRYLGKIIPGYSLSTASTLLLHFSLSSRQKPWR